MDNHIQLAMQAWEQEIIHAGFCDTMPFFDRGFSSIGGTMGTLDTDFEVSEIPAYDPCGSGEHLYLYIEKRGKSTQAVTKAVESAFHVKEIDVGCAGKKDVHAVTRQWVSVQTRSDGAQEIEALESSGWMKVLQVSRHNNKIRMGHLIGNRFKVRLCDVEAEDSAIQQAIDVLSQSGFINYFGKQRFGFGGDNVFQGIRMVQGGRARHQMSKLYVSALQSAIFNLAAARRYQEAGFSVLFGDILKKNHAGCFQCDDPVTDNRRALSGEVDVTIALPGKKNMTGNGRGEEIEAKAMADVFAWWSENQQLSEPIEPSSIARVASGTRRTLVCHPENISFSRIDATSISIDFALPAGSFATVFLRHLCGPSFTR